MTDAAARKPSGNTALMLVAACLVGSAVIRLGTVAPALAEAAPKTAAAMQDGPGTAAEVDYDPLLQAIREREAQLDERQKRIEERLTLLEMAEQEFEKKRQELVAAEAKLAATIALAEEAAESDIAQITAIYENVKAKRAAEIFESMDTRFAAGVLARMTPQAAGDILTAMDAAKAYEISVILAARNMNAGVPTVGN